MYAKILVHVKDHISQFYGNCQTLLESNSPDILAIRQTNLDGSVDTGNFSVIGYLPLIRKDSTTHMHDLAVYVKVRLFFAQDLSRQNSMGSYLFLTGFTSLSILLLFLLMITFFVFVHGF